MRVVMMPSIKLEERFIILEGKKKREKDI